MLKKIIVSVLLIALQSTTVLAENNCTTLVTTHLKGMNSAVKAFPSDNVEVRHMQNKINGIIDLRKKFNDCEVIERVSELKQQQLALEAGMKAVEEFKTKRLPKE